MENSFPFETGAGDGNTADISSLEGMETWASNRKIGLRQIKGPTRVVAHLWFTIPTLRRLSQEDH